MAKLKVVYLSLHQQVTTKYHPTPTISQNFFLLLSQFENRIESLLISNCDNNKNNRLTFFVLVIGVYSLNDATRETLGLNAQHEIQILNGL